MITAIYDGRCVICNTTRRLVRAFDWLRRVEFLDLHRQDEVTRRFPEIDHEAAMGAIHVVDASGRVFAGFAGTRRMLRELPLLLPPKKRRQRQMKTPRLELILLLRKVKTKPNTITCHEQGQLFPIRPYCQGSWTERGAVICVGCGFPPGL